MGDERIVGLTAFLDRRASRDCGEPRDGSKPRGSSKSKGTVLNEAGPIPVVSHPFHDEAMKWMGHGISGYNEDGIRS